MNIEISNDEYWEICKERDFCSQQLNYSINQMERFYRLVYDKKHSPRDVVEFGKFVDNTSQTFQNYRRRMNKKFDDLMRETK